MAETMHGDPAELLRALVSMENAQAVFQIMRLSAITRTTFLLHIFPPNVTRQAAEKYDAPLEWALASLIPGKGVGSAGHASLDEVRTNQSLCRQQTVLGSEVLPVREGGLGAHKKRGRRGRRPHRLPSFFTRASAHCSLDA